jgi:phage repressor protein C with HTH and peptisase S24 domain
MNITDRLNQLVQARKPDVAVRGIKRDIATSCGISYEAVRQWFAGDTGNIKNEHLISIAYAYDTTIDWLLVGKGAPPRRQEKPDKAIAYPKEELGVANSRHVVVPYFDVAASMGPGVIAPDHLDVIQQLVVDREWLREQRLTHTGAPNLAVVTGFGDSMEGTFSSGDPLLVDRGVEAMDRDGIYVFSEGEMLHIKRLQFDGPGMVFIISDNPIYEKRKARLADIRIHARVLIGLNIRKLQ